MNGPLRWALAYAQYGWPVFPVAEQAKVPALSRKEGGRGCLDATTDLDVVARMWRKFPRANIGVATGGTVAVLDADVRSGGKESLKALVAQHGTLPSGPMARTTSGGRHYFYRPPPMGIPNSAGKLGPGLDVRGTGGYVVVAPSTTPAGGYTWLNDWQSELSDWPDWLIPPQDQPVPIRRPQVLAWAKSNILDGLIRAVDQAPVGSRNDRLFWAACCLATHAANGRLNLDQGAAALLDAAARVGLPEVEAHRTLASALRKVGISA